MAQILRRNSMPAQVPGQEQPRKSYRLPVAIAMIAIVAGGGYFGAMNKRPRNPAVLRLELGEIVTTREFLANLREPEAYIRADLAFHLRHDFTRGEFMRLELAVRDAVNMILSTKTQRDLSTMDGKTRLKREIARAVNEVLVPNRRPSRSSEEALQQPLPTGWDSAEGPVLKVYFTSFATQS